MRRIIVAEPDIRSGGKKRIDQGQFSAIPTKLSSEVRRLLKEHSTTFFKSVQNNELENVKRIVSELKSSSEGSFSDNINVVNILTREKSGDSALHICSVNGYLDMLKYLIEEENANLELINLEGKTALHDAAQFAQVEIVKYLISKGANVNIVKKADWTPLMLACTKPDNLAVAQALVNAGADLNFINKDGWNCVHIATREGNVEILECLLNSCNDEGQKRRLIEAKSRNGRKPIHTAVLHGREDAVKFLAENSTPQDLNAEDNCGSTPIMDACRCGFINIVEYLVDEKMIDPRRLNRNGVGLLHVSAEADQGLMIEFLVRKYSLDVDEPSDLLSFTPLHWAAREGNIKAAQVLLNLGASPNLKDAKGRTAREVAAECGAKTEICKIFS